MVHGCMVYTERTPRRQQLHVAPAMQQPNCAVSTPTWIGYSKTSYKSLVTHSEPHAAVVLRVLREPSVNSDRPRNLPSPKALPPTPTPPPTPLPWHQVRSVFLAQLTGCGLSTSQSCGFHDFCIKVGSDESHFNVSVGSDGQSHKTVSADHNL